jgi:serine/threonine protein kinase
MNEPAPMPNEDSLPRLEDPQPTVSEPQPSLIQVEDSAIAEEVVSHDEEYDPPAPVHLDSHPTPFNGSFDATLPIPHPRPAPPQTVEQKPKVKRYRSLKLIASSRMSEIYLVRDQRLNRDIVAKVLSPKLRNDAKAKSRFIREINIISQLQHPGIVTIYDRGTCSDERPFYMMQFIDGRTLDEVIREHHQLRATQENRPEIARKLRQLVQRVIDLCTTMGYVHNQGFLHRDLKPSNVMIGSFGETILLDLGLAKNQFERQTDFLEGDLNDHGPELTREGAILGTPEYMSPEQASGSFLEMRETSDIYSLGAILYKVLTGHLAIHPTADYRKTLAYVLRGEFDPPRSIKPEIPLDLEAITLKAMSLDPQDRYQSALEMADDLRRWLADEAVIARPAKFFERFRRWLSRR